MILKGKRIVIAGMSDRRSIGYAIAVEAQKEGAELLLTSFGRMMTITQMTAKKLNPVPDILEMDVSQPSDIAAAVEATGRRWARVDGLVHSGPFAPAMRSVAVLTTPWEAWRQRCGWAPSSSRAGGVPAPMREHGRSLVTLD